MKLTKLEVQQFTQGRTGNKVSDVTAVSGGEWSQAFFYQDGDTQKIIRFSNTDEDFKRDQFAYGFNSPKLPIPRIEEIGKAFDGYFAISQRVEGEMIDRLESGEVKKIVPCLLDLFNSLRTVDTSKTTGFGGWDTAGNGTRDSWEDFLVNVATDSPFSRIKGWKKKMANNAASEIFDQAHKEMLNLVNFCPEDRHVVHNDLLHFNLLIKDNKISAMIDWGCALYGDYLYDLAMFTTWQFYYPAMADIDFKGKAKKYFEKMGANVSHFDERLRCYQFHLFLDAMAYNSFKENWKNVEMVANQLTKILANHEN